MPDSPEHASRPRRRRVFFALWPDPATRSAVAKATRRAVRACGGRPTRADNFHITVAFLGGLDAVALEVAERVPPIDVGRFELTLAVLGFWTRPRMLWLAPETAPNTLVALERTLWERLIKHGFEREARPFHPHLTLARRASAVDATIKPIRWSVGQLTLLESVPVQGGVRYEPLRHWPLENEDQAEVANLGQQPRKQR